MNNDEEKSEKKRSLDISLDDTLQLYLTMLYPQGLPEGVDKEHLFSLIRKKIAQDRPELLKTFRQDDNHLRAHTYAPSTPAKQSYSQIKVAIIQKALEEDIPSDPDERYLYERRRQARRNREQQQAEKREEAAREELRKSALKRKKQTMDLVTLERALDIRSRLEKQFNKFLQIQKDRSISDDAKTPKRELPLQLQLKHVQQQKNFNTGLENTQMKPNERYPPSNASKTAIRVRKSQANSRLVMKQEVEMSYAPKGSGSMDLNVGDLVFSKSTRIFDLSRESIRNLPRVRFSDLEVD